MVDLAMVHPPMSCRFLHRRTHQDRSSVLDPDKCKCFAAEVDTHNTGRWTVLSSGRLEMKSPSLEMGHIVGESWFAVESGRIAASLRNFASNPSVKKNRVYQTTIACCLAAVDMKSDS